MTESVQCREIRTVVPGEAEGIRLDHYLAGRFTYRSRTAWQQVIRAGEIRLNGRTAVPSRQLHAGEVITLLLNDAENPEPEVRRDYSVLADLPDYLVIDKPGNLPVHPSGCYFNNTLQRLLIPQYGTVHPVNRLDRETSGVTLFAKSGKAAGMLAALFERNKISKTYFAIVAGDFPEELSAPGFLMPDTASPVAKKRRFASVLPPGVTDYETCSTDFRCIRRENGMSLVRCHPATGRLHQIRATLCSLGFPLAGDKIYGADDTVFLHFIAGKMTAHDRELLKMERQALHAASLCFTDPFTGEERHFSAKNPSDFLLKW